jgi:hypothetical protein
MVYDESKNIPGQGTGPKLRRSSSLRTSCNAIPQKLLINSCFLDVTKSFICRQH